MPAAEDTAQARVAFAACTKEDATEFLTLQQVMDRCTGDTVCAPLPNSLTPALCKAGVLNVSSGIDEKTGCYHGTNGSIVTKSETLFDGPLQQGHVQGKAAVQFADDTGYEGSIAANVLSGLGVMSYAGCRYHGELQNGLFHGTGTLTIGLPVEASYQGMWVDGLRHGQGTWADAAGENKYSGAWRSDQKHGWGIMQYPSGSVFEGEWAHDKKHGFGTMYWTDDMERYRGEWQHDTPHGIGEHTYFAGLRPNKETPAHVVRCNRYIGMMHNGKRHGEGCMLYGTGARYEGEWRQNVKHGNGVYVFEDSSCWEGQWENDEPVADSGQRPFTALGTCPQTYVDDLLRHEQDTRLAQKGVEAALMVNNSELRALYALYSQLDIPWLHPTPYHTTLEKRSSFALLAVQLWRLMLDGCVLDAHATLVDVDRICKRCCKPPPVVAARRRRVLSTPNYAGVWEVEVADHSPYREILYPEFCSIIVRFASARYSMMPGLANRVKKLVTAYLLPLLEQHTTAPMHTLEADMAFCQYLQLIDPVMKIIFAAAAQKITEADKDMAASLSATVPETDCLSTQTITAGCGLLVVPNSSNISPSVMPAAMIKHPVLDMTPVEPSHCCTLSVRQLLYILQHCGIVGKPVANRCISHSTAVHAIQRACYPSQNRHALASRAGSSSSEDGDGLVSDIMFCGTLLSYLDFVLSCLAISQDVVGKGGSQLSKVGLLCTACWQYQHGSHVHPAVCSCIQLSGASN
eukprot:jgi/Ulvmu1/8200/UM041_0009.1